MQAVVSKLPPNLQNKWRDQAVKRKRTNRAAATFTHLAEFVESALESANDFVFSKEALQSRENIKGERGKGIIKTNLQSRSMGNSFATNLFKMNANKSTGHDGLSPKILKLSAAALAAPLTTLFNHCIRTSTLPSDWQMSNATPIHKKDEVTDKNNYRPVSVLPAISKLFEKVMSDQLYASFAPIFPFNMSGFLKGHSCATALIKLTDDWRSALDGKKQTGVVAIDLSNAFGCICHYLLLAKVQAYGVQEPAPTGIYP